MLSADDSDSLDDESDDDGSGSGSAGMCTFPFRSDDSAGRADNSVGHVHGVGSGVFVLIGIESTGDIVPLVVFVPKGVNSKCGRLAEYFCAQSIDFPSNFENQFYSYSLVLTLSSSF